MLAGFECGHGDFVVRGHAHRHQCGFDLRIRTHGLQIAIGFFYAVFISGGLRGIGVRGAHGVELHFRHFLQHRAVGIRAPTSAGTDERYS